MGNENSDFCVYCVNPDGSVKSCEEIFEGGVQYFMTQVEIDRALAEKITRTNMNKLSYWKDKNWKMLEGEIMSDEEFNKILEKLH